MRLKLIVAYLTRESMFCTEFFTTPSDGQQTVMKAAPSSVREFSPHRQTNQMGRHLRDIDNGTIGWPR